MCSPPLLPSRPLSDDRRTVVYALAAAVAAAVEVGVAPVTKRTGSMMGTLVRALERHIAPRGPGLSPSELVSFRILLDTAVETSAHPGATY